MSFNRKLGKQVFIELINIFDRLKLPFFLVQGTALGAHRNKDFVRDELDIDFGFLQEHLTPRVPELVTELERKKYEKIQLISRPFTKVRTIAFNKRDVHVDLVGFVKWKDKRFVARPLDERDLEPYAIVHNASMIENYDKATIFGQQFNVPKPIDDYLRLEYGRRWHIPKKDHFSRTRIYDYCEKEGIPYNLLEKENG